MVIKIYAYPFTLFMILFPLNPVFIIRYLLRSLGIHTAVLDVLNSQQSIKFDRLCM